MLDVRIEILHCEGCPTPETVRELVASILKEESLKAEIHVIEVETAEEALRLRFRGSPTILIDGIDIGGDMEGDANYELRCRVYDNDGIKMSWPSKGTLRSAILEAAEVEEFGGRILPGCC